MENTVEWLRNAKKGDQLTISVVMPAFNAGNFIAATLASIAGQGDESVEVILADGSSQDATLEIARSFHELDVKIVSEPDLGQLDALQKGLRMATGDIVLWLNADDIVMPGAFAAVREAFADPTVDFVYSDDIAFNEKTRGYYYGPPIRGLGDLDHFLFYRQMCSECVYWRRSITRFLDDDYFDLRVYTDYAFFLRLRWGRKARWLRKRLGAFRIREGQSSDAFRARKLIEYNRVKAMHKVHIGWSKGRYNAQRLIWGPWFRLRHSLCPQLIRGTRRLMRVLTRDKRRKAEAEWFYESWLLPSSCERSGE